jgi:hypothetical protein
MKWHTAHHWVSIVCVGIAFFGCQSADEVMDEPAASNVPPAAMAPATAPQPKPPASSKAKTLPADAPKAAVAQFTPPFPERLEMFEPPKRAQSTVRRNDDDGQSVVLMGFVNVDRPRAILSIDGVISPIHEGGEKYGVQVRVIQPPSVVLQRGRDRWTATLE